MRERVQGDLSPEPTKNTKKQKKKHGDSEIARGDLLSGLPDWSQEFMENLADERIPEFRDAPVSSSLKEPRKNDLR